LSEETTKCNKPRLRDNLYKDANMTSYDSRSAHNIDAPEEMETTSAEKCRGKTWNNSQLDQVGYGGNCRTLNIWSMDWAGAYWPGPGRFKSCL